MKKKFQKFSNLEPSAYLFEKIILAIEREKEREKRKKFFLVFLSLFAVSVILMPFSFNFFLIQVKNSGLSYFLSIIINNFNLFFVFWREFSLAVFESLPISAILIFLINIASFVFTLRLFLSKKRLLLNG